MNQSHQETKARRVRNMLTGITGRNFLFVLLVIAILSVSSTIQISPAEAKAGRQQNDALVKTTGAKDSDRNIRASKSTPLKKLKEASAKSRKDVRDVKKKPGKSSRPPIKDPVKNPVEPAPEQPKRAVSVQESGQECTDCANGGSASGGSGGTATGGTAAGGDGGVAIGGKSGIATPGQGGSGGASGGGDGVIGGSDGEPGSTEAGDDGTASGGNGGQAEGGSGAEAVSDTITGGGNAGSLGGTVMQGTSQILRVVSGDSTLTYEETFNIIFDYEARTVVFEQIASAICERCVSGGDAAGGDGGTSKGGTATGGNGGTAIAGDSESPGGTGGDAIGGDAGDASADASADGGDSAAGAGLLAQAIKQVQQPVAAMIPEWATKVVFRQVAYNTCYYCAVGGEAIAGDGGIATGGTATGGDGGTAIGGDGGTSQDEAGSAIGGDGGDASADADADGGDAAANGGSVYQLIEQIQNPLSEIPTWIEKVVYVQIAENVCRYCSVGGDAIAGDGGEANGGRATGGDEGTEIPGSGEMADDQTGVDDGSGEASADASANGGDAVASGGLVYQRVVQNQTPQPGQTNAETTTPAAEVVYRQSAENHCYQCSPGGNAKGGDGGEANGGTATGGDSNDRGLDGAETSDAVSNGGTASANGGRVVQIIVQNQPPPDPVPPETSETQTEDNPTRKQSSEQTCEVCQTPGTATPGSPGTTMGSDNPQTVQAQLRVVNLETETSTGIRQMSAGQKIAERESVESAKDEDRSSSSNGSDGFGGPDDAQANRVMEEAITASFVQRDAGAENPPEPTDAHPKTQTADGGVDTVGDSGNDAESAVDDASRQREDAPDPIREVSPRSDEKPEDSAGADRGADAGQETAGDEEEEEISPEPQNAEVTAAG